MKKPYFTTPPGSPEPLNASVERRVRFEETDPLGIVWHGRYASYFEDARVALGDSLGVGYMDFHANGAVTPIRRMEVDYLMPLKYGDTCTVTASLHWTEAARMNYSFAIRNARGELTTTGCSVQLFMDADGTLLMTPPAFYLDFLDRWKAGEL
jgi:acyl-CoA thioester hydrolase